MSMREERLQEAYDVIERELELLGATGVEDRLQDGVPDTINALREAGIQVREGGGEECRKSKVTVRISKSCCKSHSKSCKSHSKVVVKVIGKVVVRAIEKVKTKVRKCHCKSHNKRHLICAKIQV